jgi:predicted O-methyltransferase YrrM
LKILKEIIQKSINSFGYEIRKKHIAEKFSKKTEILTSQELKLPRLSVSKILNLNKPVLILEPEQANGNVSLLELVVINTLVASLSPKVLFEIGTFDGRTTLNITANSDRSSKTFTLDLHREELSKTSYALDKEDIKYANKLVSGQRFANTPWNNKIVQLFGDSAKYDFSPYHDKTGFIFIDGSHSYEYVKNDTAVALKLATNPAFIVWHDYQPFWSGVISHLDELYKQGGVFTELKHIEGTSLVVLPLGVSL